MIPPQGQHLHKDFAQANHLRPLHFLDNTGDNREGDPGAGQVSAAEGKTQDGQTSNRHSVLTLKGKRLFQWGGWNEVGSSYTFSGILSIAILRGAQRRIKEKCQGRNCCGHCSNSEHCTVQFEELVFFIASSTQLHGLEFNSTSNGFFNIDCMLFSTIQH